MSDYTLKEPVFTKKMKEEAQEIMKYWPYSYKEDGQKIGKVKAAYEFNKWKSMKDGSITYDCTLTVSVPLLGMPFEATDVHTYLWNERKQEYEFQETNIQ